MTTLTKTQKSALASLRFDPPLHPSDTGFSRSVLNELSKKGLAIRCKCWPKYGGRAFWGFALTEAGRAYLENQP